jgi:NADH:ubiquinone oxidoreductase subunit
MASKVSLITWMATLQMRFLTWRRGVLVGTDRFGNRYFRERHARKGFRERRWMLYVGEPDASQVPPEWHGWLHYSAPSPLPENAAKAPWRKEHEPNLSGTLRAYRPSGHVAQGGTRQKATGDYEAWTPPNAV